MSLIPILIPFIAMALAFADPAPPICPEKCVREEMCPYIPGDCTANGGSLQRYPECACCNSCVYTVGENEFCGYNRNISSYQVCGCNLECLEEEDGGYCIATHPKDSSSAEGSPSHESHESHEGSYHKFHGRNHRE